MRKNLQTCFSLLMLLSVILLPGKSYAQISYNASFDTGLDGWSSPGFDFSQYANATACTVGAVRANLYSGNTDGILLSPSIGTSNGGLIVMSYSYKVANWSANTTGTSNPWGQFTVEYAASASGPWTLVPGSLVNQTNHVVSGSCATNQITFTAPAGAVFVRFNASWAAGDYYLNFDNVSLNEIPNPPTPVQAAGVPTCASGSSIDLTGTPPANTTWYWQTSATGTSTANPYAGPLSITANGTYYVRAFNTTYNAWSNASSVNVTNFPTATTPVAPTAAANPACTPGTTISMPTAPAGTEYYWQGTVVNGSSNANPATSPFNVTASGTYTVAAYETATQCWSNTSSVTVTVHSIIPPSALANPTYFNYCSSVGTMPISASTPAPSTNLLTCSSSASASGTDNTGVTATVNNFSCATGTPVSATLSATIGSFCTSWYSYNIIVNGTLVATDQCSQSNFNLTPYLPLTSVSIVSVDEDAFGDNVNLNLTVSISYISEPYTLSWFASPTGGSPIATGSPIETIGTSVMPVPTNGSYQFYVANNQGGCQSSSRTLVTLNVTDVLADLTPVNVSCNGGANGSFALGTVTCGTQPFEYSVNGSPYSAVIPTNLTAGTYTITIRDANLLVSAPITVVLTQPAMPSALSATNVTYYDATLGWTTTGNETSWTVIYGPTGFDPATGGISVPATTTSVFLDNVLDANTSYQFYVFATCGPVPDTAGPFAFATDPGFIAWDSQCGPGWTDISTTGTQIAGITDDSEFGLTLPWPWTIGATTVNTITIGNNGGLLFNTLTGNVGYTATGNGMFPFVQDMNTANPTGGIYYESIGTAPNRQFIIQWNDIPHYTFPAATDGASFEIIVMESTGEVFYVYNDVMMSNTSWNNGADAEIALITSTGSTIVSSNNATYLSNNSCVRFYTTLCPNPINATIVNVTPGEVSLDWNAGLYGETNWTVIYGLDGFDPATGGTTETTTLSELTVPGLTQNTQYDFYIYSECAADNLTSGGLLVNVLTPPICSNPTAFAVDALTDTLDASWNWAPTVGYTANLQYFNVGYVNALPGYTIQTNGEIVNTGSINLYDTIPDANLLAGGVYQVYVQAVCDQVGDTSAWVGPITVVMPLDNDVPCGAETLSLATDYLFNNNGATVDFNETNVAPPATGAQTTDGWANSTLNGTTWFKFVAPASGSVRIDNTLTTYSGQTAVYDAALCSDYSNNFVLLAANDDAIGGTSPASNFTVCGLTPGNEYLIMHDGTGTAGNYSIRVTEIVLEAGTFLPTAQICYGSTIDLTTTITGNDNGGVWSAPIASVNASISGSTFNSNGLADDTFSFQYRVTDGCAYDSIVSTVQVVAPSSAGTDGTITVCKNEPLNLYNGLTGNVDLGGTWYDPSNVAISGSSITAGAFPGSFNYDYIVGNGVCPDDTSNVVVQVLNTCNYLSLDEQVFAGVSVYPNPSTGLVYVESDNNFEVTVTDANGRTVATAQEVKANNTTTIDLNQVQVGVYFIKLSNTDSSKVYRIVVE